MHALFAEERNVVLGMRRPLCALHRKVLSVALSVSPGKNRSHNHYSGLSLHNQESGKPKGPGALPTGRNSSLRAAKHPSAQTTPHPNLSYGWAYYALGWGRYHLALAKGIWASWVQSRAWGGPLLPCWC